MSQLHSSTITEGYAPHPEGGAQTQHSQLGKDILLDTHVSQLHLYSQYTLYTEPCIYDTCTLCLFVTRVCPTTILPAIPSAPQLISC